MGALKLVCTYSQWALFEFIKELWNNYVGMLKMQNIGGVKILKFRYDIGIKMYCFQQHFRTMYMKT